MKKFNKLFQANKTLVKIYGHSELFLVTKIESHRKLIKINGLVGSFQRADVERFTNKEVTA